jgi:hypothetical protein
MGVGENKLPVDIKKPAKYPGIRLVGADSGMVWQLALQCSSRPMFATKQTKPRKHAWSWPAFFPLMPKSVFLCKVCTSIIISVLFSYLRSWPIYKLNDTFTALGFLLLSLPWPRSTSKIRSSLGTLYLPNWGPFLISLKERLTATNLGLVLILDFWGPCVILKYSGSHILDP